MRTILVVNPKGGCGKTTIATNLASYYAVWGVSTALVDYDPQQSSIEWLQQRPQAYEPIHAIAGWRGRASIPEGTSRVVIDAPARIGSSQLEKLIGMANVVIVPVLPSPIDIRAAAHFIGELLLDGRIRQGKQIALVANRVKENTIIYGNLEKFLKSLKIPFVTHLRDSQNYIRAAERGIGIFELAPYLVDHDLDQWRPLIKWIDGKK
ncbi:AAA family ATPase [Pseudomonadota bacterium]